MAGAVKANAMSCCHALFSTDSSLPEKHVATT